MTHEFWSTGSGEQGVFFMASGSGGNDNQRSRNTGRPQGEDVDFGAFVSERVRSASERLKGTGGEPTEVSRPAVSPENQRGAGPAPERPATSSPEPTPIRRQRPSRYWRDSLKESTGEDVEQVSGSSQRFLGTGPARRPAEQAPESGDGDGGDGAPWWQSLSSSDDGRNRSLILYAVIGLVLLALMIFGIIRLFGDEETGGGGDPTPTATATEDTGAIAPSTPGTEPDDEPTPTETPEVRRGGDNQLNPGEEGTPAGSSAELESEVARACTAECLVRVIDANAAGLLEETGNRPSFVGGDVAWAVVSPREADELDRLTEVTLVADSEQT